MEGLRLKNFTQVPNYLIKDKRLSSTEFRVLVCLMSYKYGSKGKIYPSQSLLASELGCSREAINTNIKRLETKGYLSIYKTKGKSNQYFIYTCGKNLTGTSDYIITTDMNNLLTNQLQNPHTNNTINNTKDNNNDVELSFEEKREMLRDIKDIRDSITKSKSLP